MDFISWSWLWVSLLVLVLLAGWGLSLLGLFGNWVMVGAAAVYAGLVPATAGPQLNWGLVILLVLLALFGEFLESAAGALGAQRAGGSKRGVVLSVVGSIAGAVIGVNLGTLVLPVIGSVIGALLVAGLGAMAGALLGEKWKGRQFKDSMKVGHGAFWGRVLGTLGKTFIGTVMMVITIAALIF